MRGSREDARPSAARSWYKAHGLGNDYLVFEEGVEREAWTLTPTAIERVCHRTQGVGSDGIVLLLGGAEGPSRLRIFNPDGGEVERSGNGLRILASYLHRKRRARVAVPFDVEVGGDTVRMEVHTLLAAGVYDVSAEMGRASVHPADVGLEPGSLDEDGTVAVADVGRVPVQPVAVGNPHAVVFTDDLSRETLDQVGPRLATHRAFREGTNVQLAWPVPGERAVDALVWERGVGHTSASGTSACAVAVAAVHTGRLAPGQVEVRMEGGTLHVHVTEELDVVLRGPVQEVATGELAAGFLDWVSGEEE